LIGRFASAYGTPNTISGDGLDDEADKAGEWMADGRFTQSAYDLENTNYILAFGANITESQKPLARNLRMWGKIRRERPNRAKVVVIDPRYSVTAAKADQWIPIRPGADGALALAIAHVIITEGLYDEDFLEKWTAGFTEYKELVLSKYNPENAAAVTGVSAGLIRDIAREFAKTKPAIAWRGRGATSWPDGSYTSYAIFCLNALVGSIDVPGGVIYQEYPSYKDMPPVVEDSVAKAGKTQPRVDLSKSVKFIAAGVVTNQVADSILESKPYPAEIAIGFNSNFNMSAPGTGRWAEAMAKLPYYIHVAPSLMEMGQYADIVLPACTFLEEWAYDHCPPGSGFAEAKIKQPVVKPLGESRFIGDIIFELARRVGSSVSQSFAGIGDNAEGFVKYRTSVFISWTDFCDRGVWVGSAYEYKKYGSIFRTPSRKFEFVSGNMAAVLSQSGKYSGDKLDSMPHYTDAKFLGDESKYPLMLVTYQPTLVIENGNQNYPWAQEIFMVMHGQGWSNFAEINRETAKTLGVSDMDMVWVESTFGKMKARARVFEGIHPGVVAIARGQGHYADGRWANGMGVNPNDIIGVDYDYLSGQSTFFNTRVKVYRA
jgi:anaerobic selenocysteine-containing dehydrogenase